MGSEVVEVFGLCCLVKVYIKYVKYDDNSIMHTVVVSYKL